MHLPSSPREVSDRAHRIARGVLGPIERVLHVEAASGAVLLVTTVLALALANTGWSHAYEHVLHTRLEVAIAGWRAGQSVHFVVNEGLMTLFFFVVGLEIRREIHGGELADLRRAALPVAAAIGGMLVPAGLYLALGPPESVRSGWGVPMATDIAFAVGVLALLGKRVPPALRVLLLAVAIMDDIGAIVVIAVFYSGAIDVVGIGVAAGAVVSVLALQRFGVRRALAYVPSGVILWYGMLRAGVHPTLAGVVLGLMTPAAAWFGPEGLVAAARHAIDVVTRKQPEADGLLSPVADLGMAGREAVSPALRLQAQLHPWVAFLIMPTFALANAGVRIDADALLVPGATAAAVGIVVGLVAGKPLGILLASLLVVRAGWCTLPRGVTWPGVLVVGLVAGIGFTMAIFIAGLAFVEPALLAAAKLGVLVASAATAVLGLVVGALMLPRLGSGGAGTATEAETSTDA